MDFAPLPPNSAGIVVPILNPVETPLGHFALADLYQRQVRTSRTVPHMTPGVATEAEALNAEAYKMAVASTVHPQVVVPQFFGPLITIMESLDELKNSVNSIKQIAIKVSAFNASCGDGSGIPYITVPYDDGTNPPPTLPAIHRYSDISLLSGDQIVAYLQGYGGHTTGSDLELRQQLGVLLGARVITGSS
ncbi:hypothetical protein BS47DRAFT_1345859 [Hydnum rufescens UP504]|uniref:Mug135-like C-terminal domain-containing protein n=1 Tax=Hydnum rufescens UP504 TaxID=1448309 RepID=A0A9P6AU91_9AGAM|nr:hypothetical protein BS47DRAFT_1345859 [Hydnum rufescens UP504]